MRTKICGIRNEDDLKAALISGTDAVGFLVGQIHSSRHFILPSTAARLATALPPYVSPVLVTHLNDPEAIADIVSQTGITSIQLHGASTPDQVIVLRDLLPPSSKIILGAHLTSERDFVDLMEYYRLVNAILIDSIDPKNGKVGGTGLPCDWELAAKFVKASPIPVILAGGLNPMNLQQAILQVRPYAVDANTGLKNAKDEVDPVLCSDFVRIARSSGL